MKMKTQTAPIQAEVDRIGGTVTKQHAPPTTSKPKNAALKSTSESPSALETQQAEARLRRDHYRSMIREAKYAQARLAKDRAEKLAELRQYYESRGSKGWEKRYQQKAQDVESEYYLAMSLEWNVTQSRIPHWEKQFDEIGKTNHLEECNACGKDYSTKHTKLNKSSGRDQLICNACTSTHTENREDSAPYLVAESQSIVEQVEETLPIITVHSIFVGVADDMDGGEGMELLMTANDYKSKSQDCSVD